MYKNLKIHLVGIGGVGMSGIALVLLNLGYPVSGSDLKASPITQALKRKGAKIYEGHNEKNVGEVDVLVVSSAVKADNPELLTAKARGIPVVARAEMLAQLMRFSKHGIAVAGTHGKTTTTSLAAHTLFESGFDPSMIIGGKVNNFKNNARLGKGDFMVAEADESDGSFLHLSPSIAIITGIDREHMDYYGSFGEVTKAYARFAQKVPFYGAVICCVDHPVVSRLIPEIDKRVITYGFSEEAQFVAANVEACGPNMAYDLIVHKEKIGRLVLSLRGRHNVQNSLAVVALAFELGIPFKKIEKAFSTFQGIHRRCEILTNEGDITVIDDYGHHPEEIKATLNAVRSSFSGRLVTLFQPHRYSRTRDLFADFIHAFGDSNEVIITDIYPAGEAPLPGVASDRLAEALAEVKGAEHVFYFPKDKKIVSRVLQHLSPGDVLLTLGAGDVTSIGRECAKKLKKKKKP